MAKSKKGSKKGAKGSSPVRNIGEQKLPDFLTNKRLHCWLIAIFAFVINVNTLTHDFTIDDAIVITDNMYTQQGIEGIPGLLKYDTFKGFFKVEGKDKLVSGGRYRPLTQIMYALEWEFFARPDLDARGIPKKDETGETIYKGSSFIGHLMNVLVNCIAGIILYLLLLLLLKERFSKSFTYFVALAATLLFISHPLHTEAVANVKGRDEIITVITSLSTLYFAIKAWYSKKMAHSIIAYVLYFLALMSKENAITFLGIIPLTYYFVTKMTIPQIVKTTLPFFGVAFVFLLIRGSILGWSLGEPSMELMNNPFIKLEGNRWVHFTFVEKMATVMYSLGKYIQLYIFPHPLTHDYYPRYVDIRSFANWKVILSVLTYAGLVFYAIKGLKTRDLVSYGIIFFLATISLVSNIVFPIGTIISERFMFLPSIGLSLAVAVLAYRWVQPDGKATTYKKLKPMMIGIGVVLLLFGAKTIERNFVWKDNYTLFTTDIKVSTTSAKLHNAVGGELTTIWGPKQTKTPQEAAERKARLEEAIGHLNEVLTIHPTYKGAYLLLGNAHNYLQKFDESIKYFERVLDLAPNDPNGFNNMAITYRDAGRYYGEKENNLEKSARYLLKANEMRPNDYETLRLLGIAFGIQSKHPQAVAYFKQAVDLQPKNADALRNLANAYLYAGDQEKSNEYMQKAIQIDPSIGNK